MVMTILTGITGVAAVTLMVYNRAAAQEPVQLGSNMKAIAQVVNLVLVICNSINSMMAALKGLSIGVRSMNAALNPQPLQGLGSLQGEY